MEESRWPFLARLLPGFSNAMIVTQTEIIPERIYRSVDATRRPCSLVVSRETEREAIRESVKKDMKETRNEERGEEGKKERRDTKKRRLGVLAKVYAPFEGCMQRPRGKRRRRRRRRKRRRPETALYRMENARTGFGPPTDRYSRLR